MKLTGIHIGGLDVMFSRRRSYCFILFHLFSNENFPLVRLASAAIIYYVNFNLEKSYFINTLTLFTIFVKLYHASTVCARGRTRLLVCFGRPVG